MMRNIVTRVERFVGPLVDASRPDQLQQSSAEDHRASTYLAKGLSRAHVSGCMRAAKLVPA